MTIARSQPQKVLALQVLIPARHQPVTLLSNLIQQQNVEIEILEANLEINFLGYRWLNLQISGTNQQFFDSFSYLASCGSKIKFDFNQKRVKKDLIEKNETTQLKLCQSLKVA